MKTYKLFILTAGVCLMAAACHKEGDGPQETPKNAISATIADFYEYSPKSSILEDGNVVWSSEEMLSINGVNYKLFSGAGSKTANFVPADGIEVEPLTNTPMYKAVSPASIFRIPYEELPSVINDLGSYNPMYAFGDETNLEFHNVCGVIELTVKGTKTLSSIYITNPTTGLAGRYEFKTTTPEPTIENPNPEPTTVFRCRADENGPVEVKFANGSQLSAAGVTYRIPLRASESKLNYLMAHFTATDGTTADYIFSTPENPIVIELNKSLPLICTPEFSKPATAGMLPGEFSVSTTKKVGFAEGNLYYDGVNKVFCIEPFQFASAPLEASGSGSNSFGGYEDVSHISHFYPTSNAKDAVSIDPTQKDSAPAPAKVGDKLFACDGGAIEGWTLLTKEEMNYLLNVRVVNGGTGKGYTFKGIGQGKIGGCSMRGLLIYPDNYTGNYGEAGTATWDDLKKAGIVYLPECGQCNWGNEGWVGNLKGDTSYILGDPLASDNTFNRLVINGDNGGKADFNTHDVSTLKHGRPIRLVKVL